jgi:hypothetical protein
MLTQLDGAKHPHHLPVETHLAETLSTIGDREPSTSLVAYAGQAQHRAERRHAAIALAAYHLSERRGFEPGYEEQDWLEAEVAVDHAYALKF